VIAFLEKYAAEKGGMSQEAAVWLHRVKRVKETNELEKGKELTK
jgi:hypothetical protein